MSKYITIVYDTEKWGKNALQEIYALESSSALYYGDAINEKISLEMEIKRIKDLYENDSNRR
jgi:hypothetical protein